MFRGNLFEPTGFVIAAASFLFSLFLFYNNSGSFSGSVFAALMSAGLFYISYIILRFVMITYRS